MTRNILALFVLLLLSTAAKAQNDSIPDSLDLRHLFTPVKNQDARGTCSFFAVSGLLEAELKRIYHRDFNLSEQYMNYSSKNGNSLYSLEEESSIYENFDACLNFGLLFEEFMPYTHSYFDKGFPCGCMHKKDTLLFKSCFVQQPPVIDIKPFVFKPKMFISEATFTVNTLIQYLFKSQKGAIVHFPIVSDPYSNWTDSGRVYYSQSLDSIRRARGEEKAYHFAIICGYNLQKKQFLIRNSMGKEWGDNGYGYMSFEDFNKFATKELAKIRILDTVPLPEVPKIKAAKLKKYAVNPHINTDRSLSIKINGVVTHSGLRTVLIRSVVIAVPKGENPDTYNAELKTIFLDSKSEKYFNDFYVRAAYAYVPTYPEKKLKSTGKNSIVLTIPAEMLKSEPVQKRAWEEGTVLYLQTSIYIIDDIENTIKLGRTFNVLDKERIRWNPGLN